MSRLAGLLIGGAAELIKVTGTLSGSGSLVIPVGAALVTLTGKGGTGGDTSWYNPGQPYIAPSGYHAEQPYVAPTYAWTSPGPGSSYYGTISQGEWDNQPHSNTGPVPVTPTSAGMSYNVWWWTGSSSTDATGNWQDWSSYTSSPGQPYVAAYYDYPGQPYIAPSSGGGIYSGASTTATLNGVTDTWAGGYGGAATAYVQTLASTGTGQTLTYSIGSGGSLSYSYEY